MRRDFAFPRRTGNQGGLAKEKHQVLKAWRVDELDDAARSHEKNYGEVQTHEAHVSGSTWHASVEGLSRCRHRASNTCCLDLAELDPPPDRPSSNPESALDRPPAGPGSTLNRCRLGPGTNRFTPHRRPVGPGQTSNRPRDPPRIDPESSSSLPRASAPKRPRIRTRIDSGTTSHRPRVDPKSTPTGSTPNRPRIAPQLELSPRCPPDRRDWVGGE